MVLKVGAGKPVAATLKLPLVPTTKVVLFALVKAGAWFTVRVKLCMEAAEQALVAVIVIGYVPPVLAAGVPLRRPEELRVTPLGKAPVSLNVGAGTPEATTWKLPLVPAVNAVLFALVIAGG
jgi:hypothetical protein